MTPGGETALPGLGGRARSGSFGWKPWLVWSLGAALFCYGFFQRVSPSVMIDALMRDFAVSGAVLGNLSAFYFYAYAGLQIPVGLMVDAWGARRMLCFGAALCGIGSLVFSLADGVMLAYLGRLLVGGGAAFGFVGTLKLAGNWFPQERFAQLAGMTMMIGMLGGIGGQAPLAALVDWTGWRGTMLGAAAVGLALAAAIWLIVRDQPAGTARKAGSAQGAAALLAGVGFVLRRPQIWLMSLLAAAMSAPLLSFAGLWGVAWMMQTHGLSRPEAAGQTSLLLIGWAIGSPLAGVVSDRLRRRKMPLLVGAALGLVGLTLLIYVPSLPAMVVSLLFLLSGVGLGAMAVSYAMAGESLPSEVSGAAYGFLNGLVVASGAVFQPLIGALLDWRWDGTEIDGARIYSPAAYQFAFSVLIAFLGLSLLASLLLRETGRRS